MDPPKIDFIPVKKLGLETLYITIDSFSNVCEQNYVLILHIIYIMWI